MVQRAATAQAGATAWTVDVDALPTDAWPRLEAVLHATEQARADGIVRISQRRSFVAAHALKRLMLSRLAPTGTAPAQWVFTAGARGKPLLAGGGACFNIAHCDGMAACALHPRTPVGIDIEPADRPLSEGLAAHVLAASERAWLDTQPAAARRTGLMRLWTLKEAYVKATGVGLAQPLRELAFDPDTLTLRWVGRQPAGPQAWRFLSREVAPRHMLALAWQHRTGETAPAVEAVGAEASLAMTCRI